MTDYESRLNDIESYLKSVTDKYETIMQYIRDAVFTLHEPLPTEPEALFRRSTKIICVSDDLSDAIRMLRTAKLNVVKVYNKTRDPLFTALVRKGRPSTTAIECEIRMTNSEMYDTEEELDSVTNIIEYIDNLSSKLSDLNWTIGNILSYYRSVLK